MTPSSLTRIRLVMRPIISQMRRFSVTTPSSSAEVMRISSRRSWSGWVTETTRPPPRSLRSSIQSMGGVSGFSYFSPVRWTLAPAPADKSSRQFPTWGERRERTTRSRAGMVTRSTRASRRSRSSSRARPVMTKLSSAMRTFLQSGKDGFFAAGGETGGPFSRQRLGKTALFPLQKGGEGRVGQQKMGK